MAEGVSREQITPFSVFDYALYLSDEERAGALKDTVSCCYDRLIMLGAFSTSDLEIARRLQTRAALTHRRKENKALPLAASALESVTLSPKMKAIAAFWLASGMRRSSMLSVTRASFPPALNPAATFTKVQLHFAKTSTDAMVRNIPTRFVVPVLNFFPLTDDYLDTITKQAGVLNQARLQFLYTSHSFRRGLAVSLRHSLANLGLLMEVRLLPYLPKINIIIGWEKGSQQFFSCSSDYKNHRSPPFEVPEQISVILAAPSKKCQRN